MQQLFRDFTQFIQKQYPDRQEIQLHAPWFAGNEKQYLNNCIDTTLVAYTGEYIQKFEVMVAQYTGVRHAIAIANGTLALRMALMMAKVQPGESVITQALTFVGSANAISHLGAEPVFVDIEKETMGMSPQALQTYLKDHTHLDDHGICVRNDTQQPIRACLPVHVFGHPNKIDAIIDVCAAHNIMVVENAAEALGSFYKGQHVGTFGDMGVISFNGNKTITTGGGGMILTNNHELAETIRHLSTTAKVEHSWKFIHDQIGYNFRLSNVHAAIGCAQMEQIDIIRADKKQLAREYHKFFSNYSLPTVEQPQHCDSNFWLNGVIFADENERDQFLSYTNQHQIKTRAVWTLMNHLPMYKHCFTGPIPNASWAEAHIANLPSGVRK